MDTASSSLPMPDTWLLAVRALANARRFSEAEHKTLAWLQHEPENEQAWLLLANMREYQHDFRGAVDAATRVLKLNPVEPQLWWYRGYQYLLFGLPSFAEDDFDRALHLSSTRQQMDYAEVCHLMRAEARRQLGDYQGALDDCTYANQDASFWLQQVITRQDIIDHCEACLRQGHEDWDRED